MPTRRQFLEQTAGGIGMMALARLLHAEKQSAHRSHFKSTAKSVIFLNMPGGPSQLDLLDPKPELAKWHGKPLPLSATKDLKLAFIKPTANVVASPSVFSPRGQSGIEISDYLPHLAGCADDLCLLRAVHTEAFNHDPGELMLMTGHTQFGRPSMGSWVVYGLGSESQNLPGFVVLTSGTPPSAGTNNWSAGFLPSEYQGTPLRGSGEPIPYLASPAGYDPAMQRARLDAIGKLNRHRGTITGDAEIEARIASYELAFRMQSAAPELLDFSKETPAALEMYGVNKEPTHSYAVNCLLARRMVERGVRFVLVSHGSWDDHNDLDKNLKKNCEITDRPAAALLQDLKQRGLLDSTLVIWGGEFGRTPMTQQQRPDIGYGRDHHPSCYSMWLAGGGVRNGQVIGRTDEFGLQGVEDRTSVNDLQATVLHLLGFDHTKFTFSHMGRNFRLTDVHGNVIRKAAGG
ncbi:MAG TPA: DUF1501 domain-containing protein [Bryobacteraceae bacterium]|nr:DUF1501 domain-containing protein [Bryobacteraceae bacterium]